MGANEQYPLSFTKNIASVAANAEAETILFAPSQRVLITKVSAIYASTLVTDTDSGSALYVYNRGTSGTATAKTVASKTYTTVAATASATVRTELTMSTVSSDISVEDNEVLTLKRATIGSGTAIPTLDLMVEYVQY